MLRSISISRAMPSRLRSAGMNENPMPTALAGCCLVRSTSRPLIRVGAGGRPLRTEQQVRAPPRRPIRAGRPTRRSRRVPPRSRGSRTRSPASPDTTSCGSPDRSTTRSMWNWPPCSWSSRDFDGPTMNSTICSSVTSAIDAVAASLPSRSTVTRSAIVRTAARSCEMKMTLEPWATTSRMRSKRNFSSSSGRKTVGSSSTSTDVVAPVRWRYSRSSSAARAIATSAWPTGGSSLTIVRGSIVTPYDSSIVRAFARLRPPVDPEA